MKKPGPVEAYNNHLREKAAMEEQHIVEALEESQRKLRNSQIFSLAMMGLALIAAGLTAWSALSKACP